MQLANFYYLLDVSENIHHFGVAFYQLNFQLRLYAEQQTNANKTNEKKMHAKNEIKQQKIEQKIKKVIQKYWHNNNQTTS